MPVKALLGDGVRALYLILTRKVAVVWWNHSYVVRTYFIVAYKRCSSPLPSPPTMAMCSVVVLTSPMRHPKLGDLQEIPKGCVTN